MQLFKRSNILIVFLLVVKIVVAQQYASKNITTIDGLANNSIYSIFKDTRGILWLGTGNGVSTIIDNKITNYTVQDGLAHNNCWSITEDKNGTIWLGTYGGGLSYFDGKSFKIINKENGLFSNDIRRLFIYKENLFVGTAYGLSIIDITTKKITNIEQKSNFDRFQIMDFYEYQNEIYLGTHRDGIWKINLKNNKLEFIINNLQSLFAIYKNNNSLFLTQDGNFNINKAIKKFDVNCLTSNPTPISTQGSTVFWQFVKDKRNQIYGVADGINFPTGGVFKITNGYENYSDKFDINSKRLWSIFYDKQLDRIYLGSLDKGLFIVDLSEKVLSYKTSEVINVIRQNKREYILLTDIFIIKENNKITHKLPLSVFQNYASNFYKKGVNSIGHTYYNYFKGKNFSELNFEGFKRINNKNYIDCTFGLFEVNDSCEILNLFPIDNEAFDFLSEDDILYIRPYSFPLITYHLRNKKPITEVFELANKNTPRSVSGILNLQNKRYLISRSSGLYTYSKGKFTSFKENKIWNENELQFINKFKKNKIVISNSIGDVFIINDATQFKIEHKINSNDIIGNSISFLETYNDYIVIGTEKGVNFYKNGVIRFIDEEQGLKNKIFTSSSINNDILVIGTTEGYYEINLKKILNEPISSLHVPIKNIEINYKSIFEKEINWFVLNKDKIELSYNENILNISFIVDNHKAPNKLLFRYRLKGLNNNEWSSWSANRIINLPYLPPGNFTLLLEIKDQYNGSTTVRKLLDVKINPPFWKTWWFLLFIILGISAFVVGYYKVKINKIKLQEEEKTKIQKRIAETKMEALQSQMNPHFIFNAMNSIQNFVIDNNTDDALWYMGEFSKLMRQTLDFSSRQSISLEDEIKYLNRYIELENLRRKIKVKYEIFVEFSDMYEIKIPPMLIEPLVENIFVHAFDNSIVCPEMKIEFLFIENKFICKVSDNGLGFDPKEKKSKGLALIKERITLLNPDIKNSVVVKKTKKGTIVAIEIPIR